MIESVFLEYLQKYNLENKKILLLISGGVDSMVLLFLAIKFLPKENLSVLHIDHQTRLENKLDWDLVESTCKQYEIPFFGKKIDKKPVRNKEDSWRLSRVNFTKDTMEKESIDTFLTAHHATDLVETVIFRLVKGCGLKGLSPFKKSNKPLWQIPKADIMAYAKEQKINWNEDLSNKENSFERNKIRNLILPVLREITPNLEKVFVSESKTFAEYEDFIQTQILDKNTVSLEMFLSWHIVLQKEWIKKMAKQNFSAKELRAVLDWLLNNPNGNTKKEFKVSVLRLEKGVLFFENKKTTE